MQYFFMFKIMTSKKIPSQFQAENTFLTITSYGTIESETKRLIPAVSC